MAPYRGFNHSMISQEHYKIRIRGHLDGHWIDCFDRVTVTYDPNGETVLDCMVDQAALHGLLSRLRDSGIVLIAVNQVDEGSRE
jgi:hypothetical protein